MRRPLLIGLTACSFLGACKVEPPKPPLVETVAVLPFDNESNDLNAADAMQALVYLALKKSVYKPLDYSFVNGKLEEAGIVDGGQLAVVDPVKLGKDLGVQALIFGDVESFDYTNIGFYLQRKVSVNLKMVDVATGATLWENTGTGAHREVNLEKDKASQAFVKGLATQTIDKIFNSPLEEEARLATVRVLEKLPGFAFCGFAEDEKASKVLKRGSKEVLKSAIRGK